MNTLKNFLKQFIPFAVAVKLRGWYQIVLGIWYRGNKYHCPFCNHSFRAMLAGGEDHPVIYIKNIIGGGRRENAECPRCFSKERDRLTYLYLTQKTTLLLNPSRVLHIAPEGALRGWLKKNKTLQYVMGDKYEKGYTDYYYSRDVGYADITNLSYADNSFDLIICNHVLEHIEDDAKAMQELFRVLDHNGTAILQVPISHSIEKTEEDPTVVNAKDRIERFGQFDHVRIYGPDYIDRLEKAGFTVISFNPFTEGFIELAREYALNPQEVLFIGLKN